MGLETKNKNKYNGRGFDKNGVHRNGTRYDRYGLDVDGYDKSGYDTRGFDKYGLHRNGTKYDKYGYDVDGYKSDGYNRRGYDKTGYNINGYDREGYNREGYNKKGFNRNGEHKNGTLYDENGYDVDGYDKYGYNKKGYHKNGTKYNDSGYDIKGYDKYGYDREGYNRYGFNIKREHKNGTLYNEDGYKANGYDKFGYNKWGYNSRGFNREGIHENGTRYDSYGYDVNGYDSKGFDRKGKNKNGTLYDEEGYNIHGYDENGYKKSGYNSRGFNKEGMQEDGTRYDWWGRDVNGYNEQGFNRDGIHINGTKYDDNGYDFEGYNKSGFDKNGIDKNGINIEGINVKTGEIDDKIIFAEEFLEYGKSIKQYSIYKEMMENDVQKQIEEIRYHPRVSERLEELLSQNSKGYYGLLTKIKGQLLANEINIKQVKRIKDLMSICTDEEQQTIRKKLAEAVVSHEISILNYSSIFAIENYSEIPKRIEQELEILKRHLIESKDPALRKAVTEIHKEIKRISLYRKPYTKNEKEMIGYFEKPTDKQPKMVEVTDVERDLAKRYLKATREYICNKTMQETLMKLVKGEITQENIERLEKEKRLKYLQEEDSQLDEKLLEAYELNSILESKDNVPEEQK